MRDACFNDKIGTHLIDHLLHTHDVIRQLDNRPAEPGKAIAIPLVPADLDPKIRENAKGLVAVEIKAPAIGFKAAFVGVDADAHGWAFS